MSGKPIYSSTNVRECAVSKLGYILLFLAIQLVSLALTILGLPIIALMLIFEQECWDTAKKHWCWRPWAWIWDNDENGVCPQPVFNAWYAFYWAGLRNPVANLRLVPGVSKIGRPLWRWVGHGWYGQMGWDDRGYPVLSAGRTN
jgi:hypothetical protein